MTLYSNTYILYVLLYVLILRKASCFSGDFQWRRVRRLRYASDKFRSFQRLRTRTENNVDVGMLEH